MIYRTLPIRYSEYYVTIIITPLGQRMVWLNSPTQKNICQPFFAENGQIHVSGVGSPTKEMALTCYQASHIARRVQTRIGYKLTRNNSQSLHKTQYAIQYKPGLYIRGEIGPIFCFDSEEAARDYTNRGKLYEVLMVNCRRGMERLCCFESLSKEKIITYWLMEKEGNTERFFKYNIHYSCPSGTYLAEGVYVFTSN